MRLLHYITVPLLLSSNSILTGNKRLPGIGKRLVPIMKKDSLKNSPLYVPKTPNQKEYVKALDSKEDCITVVIGPAGTGKTLMACISAINYLKENKIDKIIITRPVVPVEEEIGFLPGSMVKKMDPWTRPIFDIFEEYFSKTQVASMVTNGQIEISPLGFMRGRTFKNAFVIADEMQNSSPNQMYMLLTRIGTNSRMVITGDLEQSDKFENNGLKNLIEKIELFNKKNNLENIKLIKLNSSDIQRSQLVESIINLYKYDENVNMNININNNDKNILVSKKPTYSDPDYFYNNRDNDAALIPKKDYNRKY
jgi:phosphate starvation-inducible PhoH-like protein